MYPMQHGTFGAKIKVLNNLGQVVQFIEWSSFENSDHAMSLFNYKFLITISSPMGSTPPHPPGVVFCLIPSHPVTLPTRDQVYDSLNLCSEVPFVRTFSFFS